MELFIVEFRWAYWKSQFPMLRHKNGNMVTVIYYVANYVWPYHETVRMSVCPSVCLSACHVSYLKNGAR